MMKFRQRLRGYVLRVWLRLRGYHPGGRYEWNYDTEQWDYVPPSE